MLKRALPNIVLIALLVGGAALRLDFARRAVPFIDDYGTVGLMSKHILEGRDYPLYFYGFDYMGALAAYVGAGAFALFGESFGSLCAAMIPFSSLWIVATYLLFRRLVGVWAGVIAAAVVAFPPYLVTWYSAVPLLGYTTTFAYGTAALYLGVRLTDRDLTSRGEWVCLLGLGALAGLAIWTNPLCVPYLVVSFGLLVAHVVRSRLSLGRAIKLVVALVVCLAALTPVIVTAGRHGLGSLFAHWPVALRYVPGSARATLTGHLPYLVAGAEMPWAVDVLTGGVYVLLGAGLAAGFVVAVVKRDRRAIRAALVPLLFAATFLFFFLPNRNSVGSQPRYFTPFYLVIAACFAFPLAYRRTWISAATALLAVVVIGRNVADVACLARGEQARVARRQYAELEQVVGRVEDAGLRHVMLTIGYRPGHYAQALTFVARERVIFAFTSKEYYYPYAVSAAADDKIGFMVTGSDQAAFTETLRCLGITSFKSFPAGDAHGVVFHEIALPNGQLQLVEPVAASLVCQDRPAADAAGLIDRDDETVVGAPFEAGGEIIVDFGRDVRLAAARLVAPDERDYPVGYTLSASTDTTTWTVLQHVENRDALTCIYGNRLYSGGRFASMECRFGPTELRYLRLSGFVAASPHFRTWRFEEVFFYGPLAGDGCPDEQEAAEIAAYLERTGVKLAVADEWLSRKIELMPGPHPDVLPHYETRCPASQVSRVLPVRSGVALVVEAGHSDAVEKRLAEATLGDVELGRHDFAHYTAFVVENAPADYAAFPGLRWNGFTVVNTARIAAADWYYRRGAQLERTGKREDADRYYRRSYETFPGIRANLERFADRDEAARAMLASLTPAHEARARFPQGVSLVGYTLTPTPLVPGEPATLRLVWELEGEVKHDFVQVFVHFMRDREVLFQADHNAVFPVAPGSTVPPALVLDEHEFIVPDDAPAGELTIELGATSVSDRSVRLKPRTKLPTASRAVEIGRVRVAR